MTGLIHFSPDAASNDVAAPPILWVEGQPAGTVNNSSREMMAALARWHSDTEGGLSATLTAPGTVRAATAQVFTPADFSESFSVTIQLTGGENTGPATLNLDGTGDKPIRRPGNIELGPGDLQSGVPYHLLWLPNLLVYTVVWPHIGRPGAIGMFGAEGSIPPGWVPCDGRSLSRSAYASLFFFIGGTYGLPDANTFRVPDLRGRAPFGTDGGTNRLTGAGGLGGGLGNSGGTETVALTEAQLASHGHNGSTGSAGGHDHGGATGQSGQHSHGGGTGQAGSHTHSGTTDGGGGHSHSGATDSAGAHAHGVQYLRGATYRTDGGSGAVNALNAGDAAATNTTGITDSNGAHGHSLTINAAPNHQHSFTTGQADAHTHAISPDGQHAHGIASVGDHAHSLSISASGGGQGHPNMPPGLVVAFAIKA
ncbi:phage tail protein [Methylobacterium flocculans]|uniref:phage tail protein n=1 Tax=Methylobacterium flocculans TaxID=2984843 RepID=UPI0021F354FB|nr:phage tail protein [Methylobacterium sp. FF17]